MSTNVDISFIAPFKNKNHADDMAYIIYIKRRVDRLSGDSILQRLRKKLFSPPANE